MLSVLCAVYVVALRWGNNFAYDYHCFQAAALVLGHGGNPYDNGQLWRMQDALYNRPLGLRPGDARFYHLNPYYNPPLWATAVAPLARLTRLQGDVCYGAAVMICGVVGVLLTLRAFCWRRHRAAATAVALVTAPMFVTLWFGQQATLLLLLFAAALLALSRGRAGIAGVVLAGAWIKPHLLVPPILLVPLLLSLPSERRRYLAGFGLGTALGVALTLATTGPAALVEWCADLLHYSGSVDVVQNNLPSLGGLGLVTLPHPWNRVWATALTGLAVVVLIVGSVRARRAGLKPWEVLPVLMAAWLFAVPYTHTPDHVLLLPALALAWRERGPLAAPAGATRAGRAQDAATQALLVPLGAMVGGSFLGRAQSIVALWGYTVLPLTYILAAPYRYLAVLPALLVLLAALQALRPPPHAHAHAG